MSRLRPIVSSRVSIPRLDSAALSEQRSFVQHGVLAVLILGGLPLFGLGCGSTFSDNRPPRIRALYADGQLISPPAGSGATATLGSEDNPYPAGVGNKVLFVCRAEDPDRDPLTFFWSGRDVTNPNAETYRLEWTAATEGKYPISVAVRDDRGGPASRSVYVEVTNMGVNHSPTVALTLPKTTLAPNEVMTVTCTAQDSDAGDTLTHSFLADRGQIVADAMDGTKANYTAPAAGSDTIYCFVKDGRGGNAFAEARVTIQ